MRPLWFAKCHLESYSTARLSRTTSLSVIELFMLPLKPIKLKVFLVYRLAAWLGWSLSVSPQCEDSGPFSKLRRRDSILAGAGTLTPLLRAMEGGAAVVGRRWHSDIRGRQRDTLSSLATLELVARKHQIVSEQPLHILHNVLCIVLCRYEGVQGTFAGVAQLQQMSHGRRVFFLSRLLAKRNSR